MDGARDKFLARPTLPGDKHGDVAHGNPPHHLEDGLHRLGLTDDIVAVLLDRE